jgi:hypothetical protein
VLDALVVTDSHPRAVGLADDFLSMKSVAALVGSQLKSLA